MPNMPSPAIGQYDQTTSVADPYRHITPHIDQQAANAPGQAGQQLAETAISLAARSQLAIDATKAGNTMTDLSIAAEKGAKAQRANAGPDGSGYTDLVLADFDKTVQGIQKDNANNPNVLHFMQPHINALKQHLAEQSMQWEAQQRVAFKVDSAVTNAQKAAQVLEADPTKYEIVGAPIMQGVQESGLDPSYKLPLARQVDGILSTAAARGMVNQNPRDVLDQIQNPDKAGTIVKSLTPEAREVIQAHAQQKIVQNMGDGIVNTYRSIGPNAGAQAYASIDKSDLPDFMKDAVRQHVQAGLGQWQAEARQANQNQIISLEEGLNQGKPPANARQQIYALHNSGVYGPEETASKLAQVDRADLKNAGDDATIAWADQAYRDKRALDPENGDVKKAVDGLFMKYVGQAPAGTAEYANRAADIAYRTGVAPDTAVSWGRAQLVSADPNKAAAGADLLARLQEATPRGANFAIDTKTEALARQVVDLTRGGVDPASAVAIARKNTDLSEPERKYLETRWTQKVPEKSFESFAANAVVAQLKDDPRFKPGFFSSVPTPPRELATEYGNLVHDYYLYTGGDMATAQKLAGAAVARTWGVTEVNGKREIMPYAPETMFPGLTADHIRDDISKLGGELPGVDLSKVRLTPTADTARSNGVLWQLTAPDKFGAYDVVTGANGMPRIYRLPVAPADQAADLEAARSSAIANARQMIEDRKKTEALQQQALDGELQQSTSHGSLRYR